MFFQKRIFLMLICFILCFSCFRASAQTGSIEMLSYDSIHDAFHMGDDIVLDVTVSGKHQFVSLKNNTKIDYRPDPSKRLLSGLAVSTMGTEPTEVGAYSLALNSRCGTSLPNGYRWGDQKFMIVYKVVPPEKVEYCDGRMYQSYQVDMPALTNMLGDGRLSISLL